MRGQLSPWASTVLKSLQVASLETAKISIHIDLIGCPLALETIRDKLTTHRRRMEKWEVLEILDFSYGRLIMTRTNIGEYMIVTSSMAGPKAGTGARWVSVNQSPHPTHRKWKSCLIPRKAMYWCWRFEKVNWAWWSEWKCPPYVHRELALVDVWPCWRKCALGVSFEVSEAQIRPGGSLSLPAAYRSRCRTLSSSSSTMSLWTCKPAPIKCFLL